MNDEIRVLQAENEALRRENNELREKLAEAQSENLAKESFLSSMSHDIRTPMNAIIGMTVLAKKHIDEKSRVSDALGKIEIAGSHLLSLINDVLDMSRINSGRMKVTSELFSLGDLLHDTLTIVRPQADARGHSFVFEAVGIDYESLYGDPLRLRQIYVNIISNAVKYTPEHGEIRVRVWEETAADCCTLCFSCADNGIGMTKEFLSRIYEPFERVSSSTLSGVEGTGLGMSIVKKLIEAMDGAIAIESEPGRGTSVSIRIPLRYESVSVNTAALAGKRFLIVEADTVMQELYRRYLDEFALPYRIVTSPSEAVSAIAEAEFRSERYACAILGRSCGDGTDVCSLASYLHQADGELVLVLISDRNWAEIEYRATRSGVESFIPIPFFRKSLINGLDEALRTSGGEKLSPGAPDLTGRHILLAEDNLINREIACEILSATNAEIHTAADGREAVERFEQSTEGYYDLILMDIQMPVMDGYAAVGHIRAMERGDARIVPIWAMTANAFAEDIAKARQSGMNGHIAKPIDVNLLMQQLRQLS